MHKLAYSARPVLQDEKLFTWLATCYGPWQHMTVSSLLCLPLLNHITDASVARHASALMLS